MIKEMNAQELDAENFITDKVKEIRQMVGEKMAINALSGGVDSSTVTMLGHRAPLNHRGRLGMGKYLLNKLWASPQLECWNNGFW